MVDEILADVAIIGAGIAGAGIAAQISRDLKCVILEQEERPGYHSTGRSAAIFLRNYGNDVIRALTRASATMYEAGDPDLFTAPLLTPRGVIFATDVGGLPDMEALLAKSDGLREIGKDEAIERFPILNRDWLAAAAYEPDAQDIDVAALHEGWLKRSRGNGAQIICKAPLLRGERAGGRWVLETPQGTIKAGIVVNASGAWADATAKSCGIAALGMQPYRRSMAVLPAPDGVDTRGWPMVDEVREQWYCKPDGGRLFVSPSEEDPVDPHDAYADDMVLAEGLYRFEQAVTIPVERLERSWAGLRTFAPDRTPVVGFDKAAEGFFWLAGQGGYGIQTGPAMSLLAGQLLRGLTPAAGLEGLVLALSPNRFR